MDSDAARDRPTRQQISDDIGGAGWRLILGALHTHVKADSLSAAAAVASTAATAVGVADQRHLAVDVRADVAMLRLTDPDVGAVTRRDLELARQITAALAEYASATETPLDGLAGAPQELEFAVDALDIPRVRPFWKAVTGYTDHPGESGPDAALVDPHGRGMTIWFQQMDAPRPQRNRIHLDVSVPHDAAQSRIEATLAAGGALLDDSAAPAFWVLADPEGNEACICTWQARD